MKKFFCVSCLLSFLAFGENVKIIQQPVLPSQNVNPSQTPTPSTNSSSNSQPSSSQNQCPTEDAIKGYLLSQNLATYTILAIVPSQSVPGYCDVILKSVDNKTFFIRIRNDMAYVISGSVVNTATGKVQVPDMTKFNTSGNQQ
ncbi:MAG TPA: hypothetical protein ENO33_01610 [Hydrogenobaculum sp.]|nr:hypothetical protein [Hydrogenobaculum sp.]